MDFVKEHWQAIVGVVVILFILRAAWTFFAPKKKVIGEDMLLNLTCADCGYQGPVPKYNKVCRKCNSSNFKS